MNMKIEIRARDIPDSAVIHDPQLVAMLDKLEEANAVHAETVQSLRTLIARKAAIQAKNQSAKDEIAQIDTTRQSLLAGLLMAETDDYSEDDALLARRAELALFIARVELSGAAMDEIIAAAQKVVGAAVRPIEHVGDEIEARKKVLKVEMARAPN